MQSHGGLHHALGIGEHVLAMQLANTAATFQRPQRCSR